MERTIPASEANRQFARILREVGQGESFTITSHGRPIARIVPAIPTPWADEREGAKQRLLARLAEQPAQNLGPFQRDEAYDC
jgi:prevent-host-death family protein